MSSQQEAASDDVDLAATKEVEPPVTTIQEDDVAQDQGDVTPQAQTPPASVPLWRRVVRRPGEDGIPTREEAAAAAAMAGSEDAQADKGPRRVRLVVSRLDPWSVMKLAFLLSVGIGIALVVATAVVWNVLNTMEVFTQADGILSDVAGTESVFNILEYAEFSRVMSISVVIAVIDVVILTAMATLFAFLYNVTAALIGGLHVTLTDE